MHTTGSNFCLETQGFLFPCGTNFYLDLPANWIGTCTLVYRALDINTANSQSLPTPLATG